MQIHGITIEAIEDEFEDLTEMYRYVVTTTPSKSIRNAGIYTDPVENTPLTIKGKTTI